MFSLPSVLTYKYNSDLEQLEHIFRSVLDLASLMSDMKHDDENELSNYEYFNDLFNMNIMSGLKCKIFMRLNYE